MPSKSRERSGFHDERVADTEKPLTMFDHYEPFHRNHTNLLIHIVAVPLFVAGGIAIVTGIVTTRWLLPIMGLVAMVVSLGLQGRGHRLEENPPLPFTGPGNFLFRILREQFVVFPLYVITGRWGRALAGNEDTTKEWRGGK